MVITVLVLLVVFAFGVFVGKSQVSKTETDIETKKTTKRQTVIVKDKKSGVTTTTINERIDASEHIKQVQQVGVKRRTVNVSGLAAAPIDKLYSPYFGLSVSTEVVGPITSGLFYLSNGTIGASIGVNF